MKYVVALGDVADDVTECIGGKASGLNFLLRQGLPVPAGFVLTTTAYRSFVAAAGIDDSLASIASKAQTPVECQQAAEDIRRLFTASRLNADIAEAIFGGYRALDATGDAPVAVRSSATAEDTAAASFAGQQETFLYVRGAEEVLRHVVLCWASLYSAQAIGYRARFGIDPRGLAMAVVVQHMVPAEAAGVLMTLDPTTGDESSIYVESALGLGEGVVRGDVGCDRFWIEKSSRRLARQEINRKDTAHRYDPAQRQTRIVGVDKEMQDLPSLREPELAALAAMASQCETAFGAPVDMEWAVAGCEPTERKLYLLQARAETVWAAKRENINDANAAWDTLHNRSSPELHWTTANLGEAVPGIPTPLNWDFWRHIEVGTRRTAYDIGVFTRAEARVPEDVDQRIIRIFHGRPALLVEYLATMGDRMPGVDAREMLGGIIGNVPDTLTFSPTARRYPIILFRLLVTFMTSPGKLRRLVAETETWWKSRTAAAATMNMDEALATLSGSQVLFTEATYLQCLVTLAVISPLYAAVGALISKTKVGDLASLSGFGGSEMDMVVDLWRASRDEIEFSALVERHGYHGSVVGEMSSRVWREDNASLRKLVNEYALRDESEDPRRHIAARENEAREVVLRLLAAMPAYSRPLARIILKLASKRIPMRGIAKLGQFQALDAARAAARRIEALLVGEGKLDTVDDVFFLTVEELSNLPGDARDRVRYRRRQRAHYEILGMPAEWRGMPQHLPDARTTAEVVSTLSGTGVSPGVVEGVARVLTTPDFGAVKPGEILVAVTTDPSWSSVMFISSALVVDIGGALSHAAIVARELGIPCVVNTRIGSKRLQTGDIIRVDGSAGKVELLDRKSAIESPASERLLANA